MDAHANLAYSLVTVAPSPAASGTSLTVASGQGSLFAVPPANATVWAIDEIPITTNAEIVRVTAIVGDVLTIARAQEGTIARSIMVGDQIANTVTAKTLTDVEIGLPSAGSGSPEGTLVGNIGRLYVNTDDRSLWYKETNPGTNTGWILLLS